MKYLIITAFPPCQKTAGQDYTRRLINDLRKNGAEISLIYAEYPNHDIELPEDVKILKVIKPNLLKCLRKISFHPFYTKRFDYNLLEYLKTIVKEFDVVYFDFSQVHLYSLYIDHPNKILMCHDIIAQKFERKGFLQLPWIKKSERKILLSANKIITFSKKDCEYLKQAYGLQSLPVNFYLKNQKIEYDDNFELDKNKFCFYGAWNRSENYECLYSFIKNIYPSLNEEIKIVILGGGMDKKLAAKLKMYSRIEVKGFVDNPVIEIAKCQALIAPLRHGAGVKVKVIDALTSGTSVIGTDITFEGIEDNKDNRMFINIYCDKDIIKILNNWESYSISKKQRAADEFYERYNHNHFTDIIK